MTKIIKFPRNALPPELIDVIGFRMDDLLILSQRRISLRAFRWGLACGFTSGAIFSVLAFVLAYILR